MLLYLTNYLAEFESGFNVFNYLTMRAILGALTALVICFVIGPRMIELAVRGMLPKNRLGRKQLKKLKIYAGSDHPHAAQQPQPLDLGTV